MKKVLKKVIIFLIIVFIVLLTIKLIKFKIKYDYYQNIQPYRIPYVNEKVLENQEILLQMISYDTIPKKDIPENIYLDAEEVIGKCVKDNIIIKEGDFIYKDQLENCKKD